MSTKNKRVGVIGLGAMGQGLAANLARAFDTHGFDTRECACDKAAAAGVHIATSSVDVYRASDVLVLSLPTEEVVRLVVRELVESGPGGATVIFDTSTTTPELAREMAALCRQVGTHYLDAPVTGGTRGAERGELSIMVGGDKAAFDANLDVLDAIGRTNTRIGPSGHGQVAKLVNQMLMAAIYTSVNESFAYAVKEGADIDRIFQAVGEGGGRSNLLHAMKTPMLEGTLHDDFNLKQHGKDMHYAMRAAGKAGIRLPVGQAVQDFFQHCMDEGYDAIWAGEMWAVWQKTEGLDFQATIGWEDRKS